MADKGVQKKFSKTKGEIFMHYYGETDLITKLLNIAIVVVLVLGIISGIGYGMNEMKLSDEASEAMMKSIELRADRYSSIYADEIKELDEKENHDSIDADYIVYEKRNNAVLTPSGAKKAESFFGVENFTDSANTELAH